MKKLEIVTRSIGDNFIFDVRHEPTIHGFTSNSFMLHRKELVKFKPKLGFHPMISLEVDNNKRHCGFCGRGDIETTPGYKWYCLMTNTHSNYFKDDKYARRYMNAMKREVERAFK